MMRIDLVGFIVLKTLYEKTRSGYHPFIQGKK
jgi:hypothetical protein